MRNLAYHNEVPPGGRTRKSDTRVVRSSETHVGKMGGPEGLGPPIFCWDNRQTTRAKRDKHRRDNWGSHPADLR